MISSVSSVNFNTNYRPAFSAQENAPQPVKADNINKIENVKIMPYIYNMEEVMNVADIIVSRSGAMTITEIAKIGKPAIFIPFPFATENHQEYNAKVLEKAGAARIILDKDLNAQSLSNTIEEMLKDKNKLEQLSLIHI